MRWARRSFARCLAPLIAVVACGGGLVSPPRAVAVAIYKANNNDALDLTTSWWTTDAGTTNPASIGSTDTLWFGTGMGATRTLALGSDLTTGALRLDNVTGTPNYSVTISAGNTLTLNANTDYSGGTPQGIVLNSATGGSLTLSADVTLGNSQIWVNSRTLNVGGGIALGSNTLSFNTAAGTQTLSGVISGTGSLNKSGGTGTLALSNTANTFTGTVALVGGNTTVTTLANGGSNSSLGAGTSAIVMNGSNLTYVGTGSGSTNRAIDLRAGSGINNNSAAGAIEFTAANVLQGGTASARTLTLGGTNTGDNTFGSVLGNSGTVGNISRLQKSSAGRWIVTGANTYTGATVINQGTLRVSGTGVLGGATGSTGDESNIWFTSGNANASLEFETVANLGPADQIRFRNTVGPAAGQGGALVYIGTTNQTLGKTLQCDSSVGIRLESNSAGGSLTFNGAFSQSGRGLYLGGTGTGNNTLATAFTGLGSLTKRGAGTWLVTAANTNSGGVFVEAGTLQVGAGSTTGSIAGNASVSSGATLAFDRSDPLTYAGIVSGGGNLRKAGAGTLTLSAASGYTGTTTVAAGTLALGSGGSLASTAIDVQTGARLDVSALASGLSLGSGQRLGGLGTLIGNVSFGSGSLLAFDPTGPLFVGSGTLSFAPGFGITNLFGVDWDSLALNTPYTLVDTSQSFTASDIGNFGFANRAAVGSTGREAYFESGSLQFVVVPEPGSLAVAAVGLALAGLVTLGRRRPRSPVG